MNPLIIILGIVIIVISFYLINYYFFKTQPLATKIYLKESPADISSNVIKNPNSILYSFGTWVYVNNFSNCNLISYVGEAPLFALVLGGVGDAGTVNKPKLTAIINGKGQDNKYIRKQIIISNNFPMQKWVHVLVSVDTTFVDCYLDGKLITSSPLTPNEQIIKGPEVTPSISFKNNTPPDVYLAKVTRWDYPLDPQSVWSEYSAGNGVDTTSFAVQLTVKTEDSVKNYNIYSN
jgi:hypothetical protein